MRKKSSTAPPKNQEANQEADQETHMFSGVSPIADGASTAAAPSLTPADIQNKEFRVARMGGYRMRDVDEFLDELTDALGGLIAENEKLRQAKGAGTPSQTGQAEDARRESERIVLDARREASQILADARAQPSSSSAGGDEGGAAMTLGDVANVRTFLRKERDFLRSLGSLVQGHAEEMKGLARSTLSESPSPNAAQTAGSTTAVVAPAATAAVPGAAAPPDSPSRIDQDAAGPGHPGEQEPEATEAMSREELGVDDPVLVADPEPAASRRSDERSSDGSLRELFWGEED